ncbi:MAG: hypothetical protein ACHQ4F_02400 [Candidatus Dormibacteria bacterium]
MTERDDVNAAGTVTRRNALRAAGVGGLGVIAAVGLPVGVSASTGTRNGSDDEVIVGAYQVHITPQGVTTFPGVVAFGAGGTMVEVDGGSPGPATGVGGWRRLDDATFVFTFRTFNFDKSGNLSTIVTIRASITSVENGAHFQGHFSVTITNPSGLVLFTGPGTLRGDRLDIAGP